ncbi:GWxTD domain-containing protein [candidate division KSB1 bacterium]
MKSLIPGVLLLIVIIFVSGVYAQTAQDYFQQGLELKEQGKIDEAIDAFGNAVKKDKNFAEAYFELGIVYHIKGTATALKRAEQAILNARRTGYDELKCNNQLAEIYADPRGSRGAGYARSTWDKILEDDPENIDALSGLAKLYAENANNDRNRVDYNLEMLKNIAQPEMDLMLGDPHAGYFIEAPFLWDENMVNVMLKNNIALINYKDIVNFMRVFHVNLITWDDYIAQNDSTARYYNERILDIDPGNRDAVYRLGLLHFDNGELDEFSYMFEDLILDNDDDKDGHLFLGLAYHRMHEYDLAYEQFQIAKELMSDDEKAAFSNVGYLKTGGLKEDNIRSSDNDPIFWTERDPLYLTEYNERELEHYGRVAEANLRFSIPGDDIEGWKTDRGKILIKYGTPKKKLKYIDNDPFEPTPAELSDRANLKHNFWYYDDFTFKFETGAFDEKDKYEIGLISGLNFKEIAEDVEKEFPEYYEYEPKGLFIDFPYDHATFRGEDGKTQLEVYFGIPINRVMFDSDDEFYTGVCRTGVFLHDSGWNLILEDIQEQNLELEVAAVDTSTDAIITGGYGYQVDPGEYFCSVEMQDLYSDNSGFYKDTLEIEEYGFGDLQISDILLSSNIRMLTQGETVSRSNLEITANPRRFYRIGDPIYIYYEIYNLFLEGTPGNNNFTVEYSIQFAGEEKYTVTEMIKSLFVNEQLYRDVTTEFTNRGSKPGENMFLRIDHDLDKPGPYTMTLKITDNISGSTVEKPVMFRLFEQ